MADEDFRKIVAAYIEIDDEIKNIFKKIKELKLRKEQLEGDILKQFEDSDINVIDYKGTKLRRNKSETKASVKVDLVKETLDETVNDETKIKNIITRLEEKREIKERTYLKRENKQETKKK